MLISLCTRVAGILPKYQDEWVAVQAQRREQYEYVRRSIDIISGQLHDDHGYGVSRAPGGKREWSGECLAHDH
jgi:hypothetical protein